MADAVPISFLLSSKKIKEAIVVSVKLAASTVCAVLADTAVYGGSLTQSRSLVEAFYTNMINEKYDAAIDMFLPDANALNAFNFGKAYPEETIAYSAKDLKQYIDAKIPEEYQHYFTGYKETGLAFKVLGTREEEGVVTVTGRMTTDYEMSGYIGKVQQNDTFTVIFPSQGTPAVSSYHGATTHK